MPFENSTGPLSRRDTTTIAQRFNAGTGRFCVSPVPKGRLNPWSPERVLFRPLVGRPFGTWGRSTAKPSVETLGYSRMSLRDKGAPQHDRAAPSSVRTISNSARVASLYTERHDSLPTESNRSKQRERRFGSLFPLFASVHSFDPQRLLSPCIPPAPPPLSFFLFFSGAGLGCLLNYPPAAPLKNKKNGGGSRFPSLARKTSRPWLPRTTT